MNSDVLIIGGGVIGLSIARELNKKGGRQITVVDRGLVGREASWAAAGMLAPNIETDSTEEFHRFGIESLELYPALAAELLDETGVDIELDRSGTLCLAFDDGEAAKLRNIHARQQQRNVRVDLLSGVEVRNIEPSVSASVCEALSYPDDWQVENRKLVIAMQRSAKERGVRIVENTEVSELIIDRKRVTGAIASSGTMHAGVTIIATGAWTSLIKIGDAFVPFSVQPIRGQMISIAPASRVIRKVIYSPRGYLVPRADGRILVGATVEDAGFDKSTTADGVDSLKAAAVEIIPGLSDFEVAQQWAGLRPYAADGLPVIGELPGYDNAYIATAHYRNGILLAPKTAETLAARIIDDVTSPYLRAFGAERFSSAASEASV